MGGAVWSSVWHCQILGSPAMVKTVDVSVICHRETKKDRRTIKDRKSLGTHSCDD